MVAENKDFQLLAWLCKIYWNPPAYLSAIHDTASHEFDDQNKEQQRYSLTKVTL